MSEDWMGSGIMCDGIGCSFTNSEIGVGGTYGIFCLFLGECAALGECVWFCGRGIVALYTDLVVVASDLVGVVSGGGKNDSPVSLGSVIA